MARETKNEDRKQRIRDAFQEGQAVERMPAREDMQPQNSEDVELRVAPYCRVSTMSEMQAESFEIQQQYYSECIAKHPNWVLVRIYADEGISATSVKNRKDFNQMIEDCQAGKIDMIITKSVSRFARNVVDCIKYARMLRSLSPPVSIYFETENINTLSQNGELLLTVLAAMSLSACNPDRGPEYTTPAEFGEVTVSPQTMAFDSEVRVKVSVSCPYGLRNVCILYMLDGDESDVRTVAKTEPPADVTSFDYEGVIPRQRAGRKVTFRIRAITAYNVPSYTQLREYTVPDEEEEESEQPI